MNWCYEKFFATRSNHSELKTEKSAIYGSLAALFEASKAKINGFEKKFNGAPPQKLTERKKIQITLNFRH